MEKEVKDLVEVTAPTKGQNKIAFSDAQIGAFKSGYIDGYEEALALLEKEDITITQKDR
ncbi:hypothetical protein [Desulforamulus ferrireducens]|uniref:hypothetical protein n=1 Tax=Desulforamulus ferrireducens TaxID=1833852 RepID=UPI0014731996|nr:hypothetical protein [Desulforamulus ferrireducens]